MNKSILVILALLALVLSQEVINENPILIGGYAPFNPNDVEEMSGILDYAKSEYAKHNGAPLQDLISVQRQLVSGFNYKFLFETEEGPVEIIVYDQPWTKVREVISIAQKQAKE